MGKTEKIREILRNIGIEMFDVFMEDETKKQRQRALAVLRCKELNK